MQGGKTKTKMDDLHQDSQTGLPTEYFAMCFEHFEASCFNRSVLIGTPVYFERFYLEKGSVPSIYTKSKDSLDIDYPWNEGDLQIDFFWETFFRRFFGTYWEMSVSKIVFFFDWVGLFEICFQSSDITDPRHCPRRWAYFRVPLHSTKACQGQTNNKLSTAKINTFKGSEKHHRAKHDLLQISKGCFSGKIDLSRVSPA